MNDEGERRASTQSQDSTVTSGTNQSGKEARLLELVPNKLYFTLHANEKVTRQQIQERPDLYFFSCNLHESYIAFARDFGPVNLGTVFRFWRHVRSKAMNPALGGRPLVYYSNCDSGHIANAAFLLSAFMVLEHGMSSDRVVARFDDLGPRSLVPFRDASVLDSGFRLTLKDCIGGLIKAKASGWFDLKTFNAEEFDRLEHPLGGDMSVIGDRFVAFRGPVDNPSVYSDDFNLSASFYATSLRAKGVAAVVRLNEPTTYYAEHFEERGIAHHELHFADCSNPSAEIVEAFLDICDAEPGVIGVHCKAGLGRTGTLIAVWMMKHHAFTAREAIAWLRIVRPGSVIGQQQNFLLQCEQAGFLNNSNRLRPLPSDADDVAKVEEAEAEEVAKHVADAANERAQAQLRLPTLPRAASAGSSGGRSGRPTRKR